MKYKVNDKIVAEDGDWLGCPNCDHHETPLLKWMFYCPCCGVGVYFDEYDDVEEVEDDQ